MIKKLLKTLDILWAVYVWACVFFVTLYALLFLIFGGHILIEINTPW